MVIDDIPSEWAWSASSCVLPYNTHGSRILAVTQMEDVATFCCVQPIDSIHFLKPLRDHDSKSLMSSITSFPSEDWSSDTKVYQIVLKMCGGMPLAIHVAAGFLHAQPLKPDEMLEESILSVMNQDTTSQGGMRKILEIVYADMPLPVKSCFLNLTAFPENYIISKDRLIRRWIAEELIPSRSEQSLWQTGENYLNYLTCRKLIEPVFND